MTPKPSYALSELAEKLNAELKGDPNCIIEGIATLARAQSGQISFLNDRKYQADLINTKASAVVLRAGDLEIYSANALICADPYLAYAKLSALFDNASKSKPGVHPSASVASTAKIDPSVSIAAHCVIGEHVVIGANSVLKPGVVIDDYASLGEACYIHANVYVGERVKVGSRVIIHPGAVLGSDGFGNAHSQEKTWVKIYQLGTVIVANDVEIGANTCIDRGALEDTVIEDGVRLDNLIQVAHNVRIGAHTAIAACSAIAGGVNIGRYCMIGGSVNINGHVNICDGVIVTAASGISKSIKERNIYSSGIPVQTARIWRRLMARFKQLDNIVDRLKALEKGK